MNYQIRLAATAKADIREAADWLRNQTSPAVADRWLSGLYKKIGTLQTRPQRCPVAAESHKFPDELREQLHGRRKGSKHRIIFAISDQIVYVLYVRHSLRDEIEPNPSDHRKEVGCQARQRGSQRARSRPDKTNSGPSACRQPYCASW